MRQIKFRGKDEDTKEWLYGFYTQFQHPNHQEMKYCICTEKSQYKKVMGVIPDTVSQFTGLVDRNGKEIYENDIVSFPLKHKNLLVEWNDDLCVYQFSDGSLINSGDNYSEIIFIVGDVFDNPELLNEKI